MIIFKTTCLICDKIYTSQNTELIAVKIETHQKSVILCAAYHPPKNDLCYLEHLGNDIKNIMHNHKTSPLWAGGDFNLPDIDWNSNFVVGHQYPKVINDTFLKLIKDLNLEQTIDFPTRNNNYLDLLLTNNPSLVTCVADLSGISDHTSIAAADILCHPYRNRLIKRDDFSTESSVEAQWSEFRCIVESSMNEIPSKEISTRFNQPWIIRDCKKLSKQKKRLYNRAKRTHLQKDWEKFKRVTAKCKKACRAAHDKFLHYNVMNAEANPKKFYRYIKTKRQDNISVAALKENGKYVIHETKNANILNRQYCSAFSLPDDKIPSIETPEVEETMPDIAISKDGVKSLLNRIKSSKAP